MVSQVNTFIIVTTISVVFLLILGLLRLFLATRSASARPEAVDYPLLEVLVPVKGVTSFQEMVVDSLLDQSYPNYKISFIVEDEKETSLPLLQTKCRSHSHCKILIAGTSESGGQKNHNLAFASGLMDPDTKIIITCDSSNLARPHWLESLTLPIRSHQALAVTTFRTFHPNPLSLAGTCQAVYGSMLSLLIAVKPKPWGGATAIRRDVFDDLHVRTAWLETVVDDLVLGNLLEEAGVEIQVSPDSSMETPLSSQSLKGLLSFLRRQILFPKFTNPGVWLSSMLWQFMMSASLVISLFLVGDSLLNRSLNPGALVALGYLAALLGSFLVLNALNPHGVRLLPWLIASVATLAVTTYVYVHSLFVDHIDWGGKRYYCGPKGVVKRFHALPY